MDAKRYRTRSTLFARSVSPVNPHLLCPLSPVNPPVAHTERRYTGRTPAMHTHGCTATCSSGTRTAGGYHQGTHQIPTFTIFTRLASIPRTASDPRIVNSYGYYAGFSTLLLRMYQTSRNTTTFGRCSDPRRDSSDPRTVAASDPRTDSHGPTRTRTATDQYGHGQPRTSDSCPRSFGCPWSSPVLSCPWSSLVLSCPTAPHVLRLWRRALGLA